MTPEELISRGLDSEFVYATSRSGGPGGQNVNKVNTKVELRFNVHLSVLLTDDEKILISEKLKNKINSAGELILVSQDARTQLLNKSGVTIKFFELVSKALTKPKRRRLTRPTMSSKIKRLDDKKNRGSIKKFRRDSGSSND